MFPRLSTEDYYEVCFEILYVNSGSSSLPDFEQLTYSKHTFLSADIFNKFGRNEGKK